MDEMDEYQEITKKKTKLSEPTKLENFEGVLSPHGNIPTKYCIYCDKYVGLEYFLLTSSHNNLSNSNQNPNPNPNTLDYCIHCWAWLNSSDFKLETGLYIGGLNQEMVLTKLKIVYPIHKLIKCTNASCLFNQIDKLNNENKLNNKFISILKIPLEIPLEKTENKIYKIKNKCCDINFKKSYIII